jgi:hypothetical protein
MGAGGGGVELVRLEDGPLRWKLHHSAKKSAKHCFVCDTYGCLGTTALPEQKFADFSKTAIRTFLTCIFARFLSHYYEYFTRGEEITTDTYSTALLHIFSTR